MSGCSSWVSFRVVCSEVYVNVKVRPSLVFCLELLVDWISGDVVLRKRVCLPYHHCQRAKEYILGSTHWPSQWEYLDQIMVNYQI